MTAEPETEPKGRRGGNSAHHWIARDYDVELPCDYVACPAHRQGMCSMPSAVRIGANMKCKTGEALIASVPPKQQRPLDGD